MVVRTVIGNGLINLNFLSIKVNMEIINATDGYKLGHHRMYPEGTQMVYKHPKTDDGTKNSLKGLIRVEKEDGKYVAYDQQAKDSEL